jgi:hypothetical protein
VSDVNPSEYEAGAWIKSALLAASVIGPDGPAEDAYLDVVPSEATFPAVRFSVQRRDDVRTNAQHIAVSVWDFLVIGISEGHAVTGAKELADAIDLALHRNRGTAGSTEVLACTRVGTYGATPYQNGHQYRHGGAVYRIVAQAS